MISNNANNTNFFFQTNVNMLVPTSERWIYKAHRRNRRNFDLITIYRRKLETGTKGHTMNWTKPMVSMVESKYSSLSKYCESLTHRVFSYDIFEYYAFFFKRPGEEENNYVRNNWVNILDNKITDQNDCYGRKIIRIAASQLHSE